MIGWRLGASLTVAGWGSVLLSALSACRDVRICESDPACRSLANRGGEAAGGQTTVGPGDTENAGDSAGGVGPERDSRAGSGGRSPGEAASSSAGSSECAAPYANCDVSSLTPCETDTSRSAPHCGGCNKKCTGICKNGQCLQPTSLFQHAQAPVGGLVRAGRTWYALTSDGLLFFDEVTNQGGARLPGPTGFDRVEAGLDRVYLRVARDDGSTQSEAAWRSLPYVSGSLLKEDLSASALAVFGGNLYFLKADQMLYRKDALGGDAVPYCKLPTPSFEFSSASVALPVVFRTGSGESFDSDIVVCSASEELAEPIQGKVIHQGGHRNLEGQYENGSSYWDEGGTRLNVTDASGATRVLFESTRTDDNLTDFLVRGRFVYASWGGSYFGGFRIIPIDEPDYSETVGTFRRPTALVVDGELGRLCYSDEYEDRIACIPFSDLSP